MNRPKGITIIGMSLLVFGAVAAVFLALGFMRNQYAVSETFVFFAINAAPFILIAMSGVGILKLKNWGIYTAFMAFYFIVFTYIMSVAETDAHIFGYRIIGSAVALVVVIYLTFYMTRPKIMELFK